MVAEGDRVLVVDSHNREGQTGIVKAIDQTTALAYVQMTHDGSVVAFHQGRLKTEEGNRQ